MPHRPPICAALCATALLAVSGNAAIAVDPHVLVATSDGPTGSSDRMDVNSPWNISPDVEAIAPDATVRVFFDRIYSVSPSTATVQVIDPNTHQTITTISVGAGTTPHDILVTEPGVAYVSRYDSSSILKVDPTNGATLGLIDLAALADPDGLPEMSMMARDGGHLLVQLQRLDRSESAFAERPAYLGVVDLDTDQVIDVDPTVAGVQGITLVGKIPQNRMHVEPLARRLFVSAPGPRLDISGGIEEIDLDNLVSLGFILPEEFSIGDVGGFVMTSPDTGYAIGHTDIVESSHLFAFTRTPTFPTELYFTFGITDVLAHDAVSGQLFILDPFDFNDTDFGVNVFDAADGRRLTDPQLHTGGPPKDLAVVRSATPGESRELLVTGHDLVTGQLSLSYRPACGATDHNIVLGPLQDVGVYGYSDQVCGIGTIGTASFEPGNGSWFFLVVGTDDEGREGSYGGDGSATERPEDLLEPLCSFTQDLSFSCDR